MDPQRCRPRDCALSESAREFLSPESAAGDPVRGDSRYSVERTGIAVIDVTTRGVGCADFGYAPESGTLVVPTFQDGRVFTYRLDEGRL